MNDKSRANSTGYAMPGCVYLVGGGPGDPDLITVRGAALLASADAILHDELVHPALLERAREGAEIRHVGKRGGDPSAKQASQAAIDAAQIELARAGKSVVRLKGGDPFLFGRGSEEAEALAAAGVPFEIVPGLTAAVVAPAVAGVPVTHRGVASAFLVVSGHAPDAYARVLQGLPVNGLTIVVLMGFAERGRIARLLVDAGWPPATPSAIVTNATQPSQGIWTGPLEAIGQALAGAPAEDAHAIVIGEVVEVGAVIARGLVASNDAGWARDEPEEIGIVPPPDRIR